ncbi:transmembrane protein, putative (macronuclear) [Tetrahymena thermophila SB210]|uniref:Transmembrane protein, putative n=1 Tax=Tetrahymena thermophila (strain SB210) TaxID=312017 RepID=I7M3R7_TETTS|nr:transmembrane protein, putative [Tetrahymena thermophila SB210]EAS03964.2 transmembrane protein, putative [Tetrahymena thermophila SB210]|eukprot:XP_001024209.2 transmembrane protein, putative [Tetrahymena thermophila SB210]
MGILLCRKKKKNGSLEGIQHELIINQKNVDVYNVKKQLKDMKNHLKSIKIINCTSNRDRFESVDILLLREDLQVSDFPKLQSVSIDFIRYQDSPKLDPININNSSIKMATSINQKGSKIPGIKQIQNLFKQKKLVLNEQQSQDNTILSNQLLLKNADSHIVDQFSRQKLDDKLYEKALKTIQKDMKTHLLLRYTVNQEQLIINQLAFKDKRAFLYMMRKMKQLNCTLKTIIFKDIITLKKNIFITICQQMREIQYLEEIQIINTNLMSEQVLQLQYFLCWMQKQVKILIISGANLIDEHIDILFFQKFKINDFYALENLELKNCPQLWKSDKYILLMKQYTQLKLNQSTSNFRQSANKSLKSQTEHNQPNNQIELKSKSLESSNKVVLAIQNGAQIKQDTKIGKKTSNKDNQQQQEKQNHSKKSIEDDIKIQGQMDQQVKLMDDQNKIVSINDINLQINENKDRLILPYVNNVIVDLPEQKNTLSDEKIEESGIKQNIQEQKAATITQVNQQSIVETEAAMQKEKQNIIESESRLKQIYLDMTYDNRHERQFLIGQFLWENQIQESYDENDLDAITNNGIKENNLSSSHSVIQGNNSNIADKGMTQQDNQFFNQFFKQCIRDLMELDMCKIIDFSSLNYQNFSNDQKKQISQFIISSNAIQTFIIQYDRIFFKEFCELISNKYKTKRQRLFDSYEKELVRLMKSKNTEEFNYYLENPQIFFNSNLKNNLFSLENITIIASKLDQFQFDSFCFISFLSMFLLSIEIDFQKQQVEDQVIFPTHYQVLEYLRKMVEINNYDEFQQDNTNNNDSDEEEATTEKNNKEFDNKNEIQNLEDKNSGKKGVNQQNNEEVIDLSDQNKKIKNSYDKIKINGINSKNTKNAHTFSSQIFEAIRNYQNLFDLQTSLQDFKLKNFTWKNAQGFNNDKSFSQFLFTYFSLNADSIMNLEFYNAQISHSSLSRVQEIIKIVFSKYKYYNQNENPDLSTSILNYNETIQLNKLLQKNIQTSNMKSSFRNSGQIEKIKNFKELNFMKTQKSILYNPSKINSNQTFHQKNSMRDDKQNQIVRASGDSQHLKDNYQNIQKPQKSILEMSKSKTKSKYFLNKFKIKFIEKKIINVKQILNSFGKICKYVEILNATCLDPYELEIIQRQEQQIAEQALSVSKMQQSIKLANQQGALENPNLFYQRAKMALNNLGQSNQFGNPSMFNSSSVLKQSKDNSKNYQNSSNQNWEQGKSQGQNQNKNILSSIKLVDYIGFSLKDVLEINNQMDNITELVLIRCRLQLQTFTQIAQKICSFKNLKKLVISGNNFSVQNQVIKNEVVNNNLQRQGTIDMKKSVIPNLDLKNDNQNQKKLFNFQNQKYLKQQLGNSIQLSYNQNQNQIAQSYANIIQEEGDVEKQTEEMFKLCIQNILQIQNLKYIDLSNNELDECFGLVLYDELAKRSLYFLEGKSKQQKVDYIKQNNNLNQQNQQLNQVNEIPSSDSQNEFSFNNQNQLQTQGSRKSGFYSKFIAQQLNSNVNQRNTLNGNKKFSKLRQLNTKFFSDSTDNYGNEIQKQKTEKQTEQNIQNERITEEEAKENYQKIKNSSQEEDNNANLFQIQYTEDRILDPQFKSSENINQNLQKENQFFADKDIYDFLPTFRNQRISLKEPVSLVMNTKYTAKANKILENIPENDLERLESKFSQQNFNQSIQDNKNLVGGEAQKRGSKLDKEDLLHVPDILEFYLQNNNFKEKTIVSLMKQIGILFDKLKVLDISAKSSNQNKKLKQSQSINQIQQSQQLQNQKNKFQISDLQESKLNNQISSDFLSGKSEQESSYEKDLQSIVSSLQQDSIQSDSIVQNNIPVYQNNLNYQREQQLEKLFTQNSQNQFQNLQKLSIKDIGLQSFQQHSLIGNLFSFPSIQELDLSGCLESDKSVELLLQEVNAILVCQLKKINLSRNKNLKRASWKSLSVFFISEVRSIETLNLSDCQLNEDKISGLIEGFNELQKDCSLQELILARNIRLEGILKKFIFILTQINYLHLQVLDLSGCNLNDQSCENMIQGLLYGKKKRHEIINNYLLNIENPQQQQEGFQNEFINLIKDKDNLQKNSLVHSKSFQLIKLILYDNNISMKMQLLTQYCFVFQIQEEDNILFRMHFSSNEEQKKQLSNIWNNLKAKKGLIYSNLHHHLLEEYSVSSQTLVLGPNLFSSKKVAEDILLNCLRTFNSIRKLKLHVNDKIVSIMNGIANQEKLYGQESSSFIEKSTVQNKQKMSVVSGQGSKQNNQVSINNLTNQSENYSSANYSKGFIIIQHEQKRGSKKMTFIPRSRFEHKPHTQIQEKQPKVFQIDRQITLPNDLANINQNNIKQLENQRSNNNHLTYIQESSNNKSNIQNNQFGIKNRLQELSNQMQKQKNENKASFTIQGVDQNGGSQDMINNKKRSSSLLNQLFLRDALMKKKQRNSLTSKSPLSRKSYQENTPQSITKNMENINGNFSSYLQTNDQILNHNTNQEVIGHQKDQFLSVKKNLISEMSEQNSFINDLVLVSNSEKQSSNEVALNNQVQYQNTIFKTIAKGSDLNQRNEKYFNDSFNFETLTNLEINNAQQIPDQNKHKKMVEINKKFEVNDKDKFFLQPQSPKKTKSIIKNNRSILEAEKDQQKRKSFNSPSFDIASFIHPQPLSNKSSFLFGKDSNVKKTQTIIDQHDKNNANENIFHQKQLSFKSNGTQIQTQEQITISRNQSQNKGQLNEQHIQQINEKINNPKYENSIIHLQDIESLILHSDEKVGIVNLLEFFSVIADNIKIIDFSKIIMSHSMFVRVAFRVLEIFENINQVKFANLQLQLNNEHLLRQTGQALHYIFTTPSIDKLEFLNCQITEQLIEYIIYPEDKENEPSFFAKDVNFSKNKNISFSKEENLILLENAEILNLSDCNLNDKKINININTWKRDYLESLIDLDLSYNKALSPKFFCNLGQYISKNKILQRLNISYTGMYVEKQKQFSYGLHYKNGIHHLALQKLIIKEMRFCKKEGTLMLFKALSKLQFLEVLDMSEMQVSNYQELDILHNYLRHEYIGKFTKVKKFYLQNCQFLFDTIPYYDFNSKYSLLEYNHFSLFLLTQFENIILLDLTGCLNSKKFSKKFLQELDIMRRKKLFNSTIKSLNISKNLISAEEIRDCVCNILFLFKNLQILQMRSLVHYEQNYVQNILDGLDSFSYFQFLQNQNYQDKKDAEQQGKEIAEAFLKIKNQPLDQLPQLEFKDSTNNVNRSNMQKDSFSSKFYSFNSSQLRQLSNQEGSISINLSELVISDISNELIHNKGNIDMLLDTWVTNKIFANLKKIFIYAEYTQVTNLVRLQSLYNDSLLELNEKVEQLQIEPNSDFEIRFKFKESQQLVVLKPEKKKSQLNSIINKEEKVLKKSIYFNSQIGQQSGGKDRDFKKSLTNITQRISQHGAVSTAQDSPQIQKQCVSSSFTKMRLDYLDEVIEEEEDIQAQNNFKNSFLSEEVNKNNQIKHSHFSINEQNEYLFHSFSSENEDDQIQIWRQFQSFLKKLSNPKLNNKTHISLNYKDPKLKLLSSQYNIFIDNKYELNTNMNILFNGIDSLYLGNMLYYFLVQICSFKPKADLIDFLINLLIFMSQNKFQDLTNKIIKLPPFLILNEEDASRIQSAFMNIQIFSSQQKKMQTIINSLGQKEKLTFSQYANTPTKQISLQSRISNRDESGLIQQRNRLASQQKHYLDKKRQEYSSVTKIFSKGLNMLKKNVQNRDSYKNKIVCNYFYKSSQGCKEYIEIEKIKKMPPSTLNIENFSINGLKSVYMICYHNDYFIKGDIDYESIMFVSTSLAFSLREYFYQQYTSQKRFWFSSLLHRTMYLIMDIFVDIDSYFKYDESIDALDRDLRNSKKSNYFFIFMIITLQIIIYILTPIFSFIDIGPYDNDHLSYIIHSIFALYAIVSFVFEIFYMRKVLILTRHLIPDINLVHQNNLIAKVRDYVYEKIMNIQIFNYKDILFYQKVIFSFLSQLDAYQDVCFILVTYHKEDYLIAIFALIVLSYTKFIEIILFFKMIEKTSYSNLFFYNTNIIYEYCQQTYLEGLSSILDVISPHNVIRITDNFFTSILFPKKALGLTINKQIFHRIRKVVTCDLPQILLQILYIFRNMSKQSTTVQLSIALNIISLIKSMYVLLTIKQSVLNQMDFDELSEQKSEFLQEQFLQYQHKEIEMFDQINNNVQQFEDKQQEEQLKSIASSNVNQDKNELLSSSNQQKVVKFEPSIQKATIIQ